MKIITTICGKLHSHRILGSRIFLFGVTQQYSLCLRRQAVSALPHSQVATNKLSKLENLQHANFRVRHQRTFHFVTKFKMLSQTWYGSYIYCLDLIAKSIVCIIYQM